MQGYGREDAAEKVVCLDGPAAQEREVSVDVVFGKEELWETGPLPKLVASLGLPNRRSEQGGQQVALENVLLLVAPDEVGPKAEKLEDKDPEAQQGQVMALSHCPDSSLGSVLILIFWGVPKTWPLDLHFLLAYQLLSLYLETKTSNTKKDD